MMGINARAVFLCTKLCLPHLEKSSNAHVLSLSPPVSNDAKWLKGHAAYTLSKYGMSLLTFGLAEELREKNIAMNALWPRTLISTAAVDMLLGEEGMKASRTPEIMADAAYEVLTTEGCKLTGQALIDEHLLRERGVKDFAKYATTPGVEPSLDLYVEE
jgi:citronellol/citronellal dehydrogenase